MELPLAQRHLADNSVDFNALLDGSVAEIATAVAELRQIAHGLRPSSLDDGLAVALTNLSRPSSIPIHLSVDVDALPDLISTTAYFVANEAIATSALQPLLRDRPWCGILLPGDPCRAPEGVHRCLLSCPPC